MTKGVTSELRREFARVLMDRWDPIGIRNEPAAAGEYDIYVDRLIATVFINQDIEYISSILAVIQEKEMGLVPNVKIDKDVSEILLKIYRHLPRE